MTMFDIGIDYYGLTSKTYSLNVNGKLVRENIDNLEDVVKEIKKYLRLRFKENLK